MTNIRANTPFFFLCGFIFFIFSAEGLVKVDENGNIIGSNVNIVERNNNRQTTVQDVANAGVDAADLLSVLGGIALPLLGINGNPGANNSWLHLPRTRPGNNPERLETHLLRGHGPAGGISQSHIMSASQFSSGAVHGIQAPAQGIGLALDPNMPLAVGGVFGGNGAPVIRDWNQLQRDMNSVNIPIHTTVNGIIGAVNNGNQVNFQCANIARMRKFTIDLTQASLANCPRPIIFDGQHIITVPPLLSEGWLKKPNQGVWRVSPRARFLVINVQERSAQQANAAAVNLGNIIFPAALPVPLQQQAAAVNIPQHTDVFGRELQRIPMTIYFCQNI